MATVTTKQLDAVVRRINRAFGTPTETYIGNQAQIGNYHLDAANGGTQLCQIVNYDGGARDVLESGHVTKRELLNLMFAYVRGRDDAFTKPVDPRADFFLAHAGYSYDPKIETEAEGRLRCARELATAEIRAIKAQVVFEWQIDQEIDSSDFDAEMPAYPSYVCQARVGDEVRASISGIDFGRGNKPAGQPYKRVIEAELALELNL